MKKSGTKPAKTPVNASNPKARQRAPLLTPTDFKPAATRDTAAAMNGVLADVFALYVKTKSFHRHMSGPHFGGDHIMLDAQADQLHAMPTRSPSASASSAAPRCVRSAIARAPGVSSTTMLIARSGRTCWPS